MTFEGHISRIASIMYYVSDLHLNSNLEQLVCYDGDEPDQDWL